MIKPLKKKDPDPISQKCPDPQHWLTEWLTWHFTLFLCLDSPEELGPWGALPADVTGTAALVAALGTRRRAVLHDMPNLHIFVFTGGYFFSKQIYIYIFYCPKTPLNFDFSASLYSVGFFWSHLVRRIFFNILTVRSWQKTYLLWQWINLGRENFITNPVQFYIKND